MQERLSKLVGIFEGLDFRANRAHGDDLLGDAYGYLMRHFATQSGKSKGQFYTPAEVSRIMAQVIGIGPDTRRRHTVYDPTCGSGSLLIKAADETPNGLTIYGLHEGLVERPRPGQRRIPPLRVRRPVTRSCRSGAAVQLFPTMTGQAGLRRDRCRIRPGSRGRCRDVFAVLARRNTESSSSALETRNRKLRTESGDGRTEEDVVHGCSREIRGDAKFAGSGGRTDGWMGAVPEVGRDFNIRGLRRPGRWGARRLQNVNST